jgi:apolipoprotein D and lipocalin family protein
MLDVRLSKGIGMRVFALIFSVLLLLQACASTTRKMNLPPLQTQPSVQLDQFMGRWFVIANIPYSAENGKVGSYVEYRARPDGRMDDLYFFRKKNFSAPIERWEGVAWVVDKQSNARWKAQFIWPLSFDYLILETAPDYSWALVGHPSRDLAWVFSRSAEIDPTLLAQLYAKLAAQGYNINALKRVPQKPEHMGQIGFQ